MGDPFPYRSYLELPVVGLEAEFKVFIDDHEVTPEEFWRTPAGFIDEPLLKRSSKAVQLPTGGALYFDGGVLEVVTPVIELAPECTARVVRSLWEQIGYVRDQLDRWEARTERRVRLQAFSCHFNISFELERSARNRNRTIQKLAVLLSRLLAVPVIVLGANRRSTGIGVRPRRDRIEITLDFTPDPGLMAATTALIVGVVRDVIEWPSYLTEEIDRRGIGRLAGLDPGRHPSRNGWIARAEHFPRDPFTADLDATSWRTTSGEAISLRALAYDTARHFRDSIATWADDFSVRLLFSVLRGATPALLDLEERPAAYDDVGRATQWGTVLPDLENFAAVMGERDLPARRRADLEQTLAPPWRGERSDRRRQVRAADRRRGERPKPSPRLSRSMYEQVFLELGSRRPIHIEGQSYLPVGVRGWYHAVLRTDDGTDRLLSIDQILAGVSPAKQLLSRGQ